MTYGWRTSTMREGGSKQAPGPVLVFQNDLVEQVHYYRACNTLHHHR